MVRFRILPGLPPYGPLPRAFPSEWGRRGREGVVVEFEPANGPPWTGNFEPGIGGTSDVLPHPDGRRAIVIAAGDAWVVDPETAAGERLLDSIDAVWPVQAPEGFVFSWQGLAFVRIGTTGVIWHTRRLSWDGFDSVSVSKDRITGAAWDPMLNQWQPFEVDLATGASHGGSFGEHDSEHWEQLAPASA
jgi:hypothetical protein